MGLQKAKTAGTGQSGDYWMIAQYVNDTKNKVCLVSLHLYINKAGRDAGTSPMEMLEMVMTGTNWDANMDPVVLEAVATNPRKKLYSWIKTEAVNQIGFDLSDATDIDPDV